MPVPLLPLIGIASGLASSIIGSETSRRSAERTARANMELAKYGYQKDLEMWNLKNEYDSPAAQMARLKAAGLNPNMVYGSGSAATVSGPQPRYNVPSVDYQYQPLQLPNSLAVFQDFELKDAQIDNVRAQTENTQQRTVNESIREYLLDLQGRTGEFDLTKSQSLFPHQLEVQKGQARKVDATVEQEFTKLMLMRRDELNRLLEAQSREKQMSIQDVEKEQREAELLFSQYRNQWMKAGVTTSDNPILRMFVRMMDAGHGKGIKEALDNFLKQHKP